MNAEGVEDGHSVAYHLSFKIVYLLPDDTQRRENIAALERTAFIDVTDPGLDDMAFELKPIRPIKPIKPSRLTPNPSLLREGRRMLRV